MFCFITLEKKYWNFCNWVYCSTIVLRSYETKNVVGKNIHLHVLNPGKKIFSFVSNGQTLVFDRSSTHARQILKLKINNEQPIFSKLRLWRKTKGFNMIVYQLRCLTKFNNLGFQLETLFTHNFILKILNASQ